MFDLAGRAALVTGASGGIGGAIARALHAQGAQVMLSGTRAPALEALAGELKDRVHVATANLSDAAATDALIKDAEARMGSLDILVHAVAFAPREALAGGFTDSTSRESFRVAHDVSSYSLTALARAAKPLMEGRAGAILTLSYLGAVKSIPSYNVMGLAKASLEANVRFLAADLGPHNIRVNGISAGPIKTLAAAGIAGFRKMLSRVAEVAPLRRNVTLEDVGNAAAFLCSDLANGITGEITYVDAGFSTVGMSFPQEAGGE